MSEERLFSRVRRPAAIVAVLAVVGSASVALASREGDDGGEPASSSGAAVAQPAAGTGFVLRRLDTARGCTPALSVPTAVAPAAVRDDLAVLRTKRTAVDGLPVLNRDDGAGSQDQGWLPVRSYDARGVRRVAGKAEAYVVPSATVLGLTGSRRGAPCPAKIPAATGGGACLVVGRAGGPFAVGCWTLAQIRAGRAIGLTAANGGHRLVGLRPDGVSRMVVAGDHVTTRVTRGSVIGQITALGAGDRVTVSLTR